MNDKKILFIAIILLFGIAGVCAQNLNLESLVSPVEDSTSLSPPTEDFNTLTSGTEDSDLLSSPANDSTPSSTPKKKKMKVRNFNIECMANISPYNGGFFIGRHLVMLSYERGAFGKGFFRVGIDLGFTKYLFYESLVDMPKRSGFTACLMGKCGFELLWEDRRIKFGFGPFAGGMFKVGIILGGYFRLTCYATGRFAVNVTYRPCEVLSLSKKKGAFNSLMGFGITYQLKK